MKIRRSLFVFVLVALFMSGLVTRAKVPPLLDVPDYLPGDVKKDLDNQRANLENRIVSLRGWAERFNASCGNRTLSEDDPQAKDCLDQKVKLDKAGQDYTRDALAFDDEVLKATMIGRAASTRGEVTMITPDGRTNSMDAATGTSISVGAHILTGPTGRLQVLLLDETIFTLGPDSDMVLDEFVYDPKTSAGKVTANIAKGTFRFVTGKIASHDPEHMKVKVAFGTIGPRGTDFEVSAEAGGDGNVKLFSGKLEITETKSGNVFNMDAGQMVKFHADGTWDTPKSLDAARPTI
jgi:FecR protein